MIRTKAPVIKEMPLFARTVAINKMAKLRKRIKVIPGGTSAGKTFGILPLLINKCVKTPGLEVSVVAESLPHLKKGALKDFLKIMRATNRYCEKQYNRTDHIYTFLNGSTMEFFGVADDPDKLRGARRDILYMNEANLLPWEAYKQGSIRTNKEIWIDFNPSAEFWAHEELADDEDAEWLTLTYHDNIGINGEKVLSPAIVKEIEKALKKGFFDPLLGGQALFQENNVKNPYWANWWKVYGLGLVGRLEGVIFNDWSEVDAVPVGAKYLGSGLDFGYSNHPTAIVDFYQYNNKIIWDERVYRTGLKNDNIASLLRSYGRDEYSIIVADSAEPKSIDEINAFGFDVLPAEKGKDSICFGIDLIQRSHFYITKRSQNIKKELERYAWLVDKNGKTLNKPVDAFNHALDAARYFYMLMLSDKNAYDDSHEQEAYEKALQLFN